MDMTQQDKEDFHQAKRIYAEAMVRLFESEGRASVHRSLKELFADETLKLFSSDYSKDELYRIIMGIKRDELKYRKDLRK